MVEGWFLFFFILSYLSLLFFVAIYAENREREGRSVVSNPYVYSLSLAVYCTSWTFYGSVGKAATSGLSFLTIYLGPTLMASLWWIILRKIILISKRHRITTISDFIGSRYGNSIFLAALVTVVAVIGIVPYLGLQIKAIIKTFTILAGQTRGSAAAGWFITLVLGIFAIIFGAARLDSSERHEGLIFAIAFESIVKLIAFLMVGGFVTYGLFDGFGDIFSRIKASDYGALLFLGGGTGVGYMEWASLLFLSMMAIMFLPRQFHVSVVENSDVDHIRKAMWLFPLYLVLINIFVLPVAFGGLLLGGNQADADSFVLTIPLSRGKLLLALIVFLGGLSAAAGMIIVESLALSTMVMNNLIMPAIFRYNQLKSFPAVILTLKRMIILACVFLGYFFAVSVGEFYTLVDIGLKSFEAVTIFAPSILLGLYWKRGNKTGAAAGIIAGFVIWFYTLLMPALITSGVIQENGVFAYLFRSSFLNPRSLFGLSGFDKWSHSLFWGLLFNLLFYVGFSIFRKQAEDEEKQSLLFVDSYSSWMLPVKGAYTIAQIEDVLGQYIGRKEAREAVVQFLSRRGISRADMSQKDLIGLRGEAERILSGALGSAIATIVFEDRLTLTESEKGELSRSIRQMTNTLRLSRKELAEANRNLAYLKEFSENIIESASVGIVTVDADYHVISWNRHMETVTGIERASANGREIFGLLTWLSPDVCCTSEHREMEIETPAGESFRIGVSPFTDPSGGFVVVVEDVTDKKKIEAHLQQSSKLASLGKLTAGISHEIGNPLASISSLVQELRSLNLDTGEEIRFTGDALKTIDSHIGRIARIVRSLGDFARISTQEKTLSGLPEILDRTISLIRYDKRFKDIRLKTDIEDTPPLKVNADQIQQVFLNIMLNALDAMPDGGSLDIAIRPSGDFVDAVFTDSGTGMDAAVIDRIFDPFFTTKPAGRSTGLGLSICYGIVREHKGTIRAENVGGGARFTVSLPVESADQSMVLRNTESTAGSK